MRSYRTAFPSKYLKAEDLGTTRPVVTIASVDFEQVGVGQDQSRKLVAHFAEVTVKPLVLNRINCDTIAGIAGTDDYEEWEGCKIQLFATETEFQGKRVPCIRVCRPPKVKPVPKAQVRPAVVDPGEDTPPSADTELDVGF